MMDKKGLREKKSLSLKVAVLNGGVDPKSNVRRARRLGRCRCLERGESGEKSNITSPDSELAVPTQG